MTFKKVDVIERILLFCEETKVSRLELMVRKNFIDESEEYTDELWEAFKECWLKKPLL